MEPKFTCPFCGKEVSYRSEAGRRSVGFDAEIYFRHIDKTLRLANTFCNLTHLLDYLRNWYAHELCEADCYGIGDE